MKKLLLIICGLLLIGSAKAQMEGNQIDFPYVFSTKLITKMGGLVERRDSTSTIVAIVTKLPDGYNINDVIYHTKYLLQAYDEYLTVAIPWGKRNNVDYNAYYTTLSLNSEIGKCLTLSYLADFNKILIVYDKQ